MKFFSEMGEMFLWALVLAIGIFFGNVSYDLFWYWMDMRAMQETQYSDWAMGLVE